MPILDWLDREKDTQTADAVPYRLLEDMPELSFGDTESPNMLIQGDNLEALKALLPYYAGQVKCVFIDPPYNTKSAFEHYDDNLEHSQWLSMMYPRLELLQNFLTRDGTIWVTIDDTEAHYLKVIMDEIFCRQNFVANCIWQKRTSPDARLQLGDAHDHVLVYAQNKDNLELNKLSLSEKQLKNYKNPDNDPRGPWASSDYSAQGFRPNQMYAITTPAGVQHKPPTGTCWKNVEPVFLQLVKDNRIWFGKDGKGVPRRKTFLSEKEGIAAWTWWENSDVGHNQEAKKEINVLFGSDSTFDTPKPERLLNRVISLATKTNDLVLDSFLGSGTTAAVAHKMKRRYIGIEMGEHAITHCQPRLKKVVDGEQGGISEVLGWKGGGGFRFYQLGPAVFDPEGNINPKIRFNHLAAHIWFSETKTALHQNKKSPLLGVHQATGTAYYLLYNGVLGDKTVNGGNVLTMTLLKSLPKHEGTKVIYGETCRLSPEKLKSLNIIFKQTPYDVKAR